MEKYGFIYIWYDRKHKKFYIGMHWGIENDGYICSSNWMRDAYNRRPEDFKRKILDRIYTNRQDLYNREKYWLSFIKEEELKIKYYNLSKNVNDTWLNEDINLSRKQKISLKTKEAMQRPEVREKYLNGLAARDNRSSDIEVREKRRKSMIGKNVGKDTSKAVALAAEANRGKKHSETRIAQIKETTVFKQLNSMKIKCVNCDFIGNKGNVARYHNEKCRFKVDIGD
jgi:hypothetical protein